MNKATIIAKPGEQNITIERVFDAPRAKVFAAMTEKDKLERWWVGPGHSVRVEQLEARDGGAWRFVQEEGEQVFAFHGSFHEVSPERTIMTFEYEGLPERGHVALEKMELTEVGDNQTKLFVTMTFMSVDDRDGMVRSGMEEGTQASYVALDELLKEQ